MEAIGGGASVLAFVVLGLKSAKGAYDVLSAIKDGNTHVAQATSSVQNLLSTLKRLEQCRLFIEQQDAGLLKTAQECAESMEAFAEQLEKLAKSKHWVGKQWKKVKIFLKEDDLKRVSASVVGHTAALNFYLQVLESDTILGVRDDLRTMLPVQQTIHDDVKAILPLQQTIWETQTTILAQHTAATTAVQDSITQNQKEAQAIRETIQTSTLGLATQTDIQHISDMLQKFLRSHPPQEAIVTPRVVEITDDGATQPKAKPDHEDDLEATIFFVIEALQDRSGLFADDDAQEICDALLDFMDKAFSSGHPLSLKPGWTGAQDGCDCDLRALRVNLRAVKGAILSSRWVSVNQGGDPNTQRTSPDGKVPGISPKTRLEYLELRSGTISVLTTESFSTIDDRYQVPGFPMQNEESVGNLDSLICTTDTRISFTPRLQGRMVEGRGFEAILRNSQGYPGWYHGLIPRLFLNNVLHDDSPVFRVVENGDLAKFQDMLRRGEASLRDQDEHGTPLLFYATEHWQPDMCRFLLEHGADVDYFAPSVTDRGVIGNVLVNNITHSLSKVEENQALQMCLGLLLNAGCDPSSFPFSPGTGYFTNSLLEMACAGADDDLIRILFTRGLVQAPVDAEVSPGHRPYFLTYMRGGRATVAGISMLLQYGADITSSDCDGTCLHHLFHEPEGGLNYHIELLRSCEFLIRSGADVDAVDDTGRSVSCAAYSPSGGNNTDIGSASGDVWDRALAGAGYDVKHNRKRNGIRRRAQYTSHYSREDFDTLWAGMAELCPYYYEAEFPFDKSYSTMSLFGFRSLWRQWGEEVYPPCYEAEPPCDKSYSTKSLFGFRSLWRQWGEDVVVGRLEKVRGPASWMRRSTHAENDSEEEWSVEEADYFNDLSDAESNGDREGQAGDGASQAWNEDDGGQSNMTMLATGTATGTDRDINADNGWDNDGDNEADDDDGSDDDSDDGGCRLE